MSKFFNHDQSQNTKTINLKTLFESTQSLNDNKSSFSLSNIVNIAVF